MSAGKLEVGAGILLCSSNAFSYSRAAVYYVKDLLGI